MQKSSLLKTLKKSLLLLNLISILFTGSNLHASPSEAEESIKPLLWRTIVMRMPIDFTKSLFEPFIDGEAQDFYTSQIDQVQKDGIISYTFDKFKRMLSAAKSDPLSAFTLAGSIVVGHTSLGQELPVLPLVLTTVNRAKSGKQVYDMARFIRADTYVKKGLNLLMLSTAVYFAAEVPMASAAELRKFILNKVNIVEQSSGSYCEFLKHDLSNYYLGWKRVGPINIDTASGCLATFRNVQECREHLGDLSRISTRATSITRHPSNPQANLTSIVEIGMFEFDTVPHDGGYDACMQESTVSFHDYYPHSFFTFNCRKIPYTPLSYEEMRIHCEKDYNALEMVRIRIMETKNTSKNPPEADILQIIYHTKICARDEVIVTETAQCPESDSLRFSSCEIKVRKPGKTFSCYPLLDPASTIHSKVFRGAATFALDDDNKLEEGYQESLSPGKTKQEISSYYQGCTKTIYQIVDADCDLGESPICIAAQRSDDSDEVLQGCFDLRHPEAIAVIKTNQIKIDGNTPIIITNPREQGLEMLPKKPLTHQEAPSSPASTLEESLPSESFSLFQAVKGWFNQRFLRK